MLKLLETWSIIAQICFFLGNAHQSPVATGKNIYLYPTEMSWVTPHRFMYYINCTQRSLRLYLNAMTACWPRQEPYFCCCRLYACFTFCIIWQHVYRQFLISTPPHTHTHTHTDAHIPDNRPTFISINQNINLLKISQNFDFQNSGINEPTKLNFNNSTDDKCITGTAWW